MLPTEDVKAIKRFVLEGYRDSEISRRFKVSDSRCAGYVSGKPTRT